VCHQHEQLPLLRTRPGIRTLNLRDLSATPLPLGYPGMYCVDRLGIEPSRRGLQSDAAHQCSAQSQRSDSNRLPSDYETDARPVVLRWRGMEPKTGVEPVTSVVPGQRSDQTELRRHRGAGSGGLEPPQRGPKPRGLPLAELPPAKVSSPGVEPGPAGLQPAALPLTPKGPAWRSGESNPGPSVCRTDALPTELQPHETRREPGNRTPRFLAPNQVRSPSRSFPKMPSAVEFSMWSHVPAACWGMMVRRGDRTRTCSLRFWRPTLNQLSYTPIGKTKNRPVPVRGGRSRRLDL
jgi:hypothetical protein